MATLKDARGENTKINYRMDATGEEEKRASKKNVDRRSTSSHGQQEIWNQINGETERKCVWFPEDSDSCYKTG